MIHPDYSLKILDILLKTKPDDKYTMANDSDQQNVLSSDMASYAKNRTISYSNYAYGSSAFVSIDEEVKKYTSSSDTELKTAEEYTGSDAERKALEDAQELLTNTINNLQRKNVYNPDAFTTQERSIIIPFSAIDAEGPASNSKLFLPVGSRVSDLDFDGSKPIKGTNGGYTYELTLCVQNTNKADSLLSVDLNDLITKKINEMVETIKTFGSYGSASKKDYYTGKNESQEPINPEKLTLTIKKGKIKEKRASLYCKYSFKKSAGSSTTSDVYSKDITYYYMDYEVETIEIPSWYLSQNFGANDEGAHYPKKAYIGLFTKNPDNYGKGFQEPTWKTNDNLHTYQRMSLHEDLLYGEMSLNEVKRIENTKEDEEAHGKDYFGHAFVDNKEIVLFPEILDEEGWGTIEGFGIFENEIPTEGETPYFWGNVTDDAGNATKVPTFKNRVPLFRKGEFKVYLG